jgi:general secretion pathway protein D
VIQIETRVPLLGSIPILGHLFRSESTSVEKTNLLVFIRPTIIRDDETLSGATAEKYKFIRDQQLQQREINSLLVNKDLLPLLPDWDTVQAERAVKQEQKQKNEAAAQKKANPDLEDSNNNTEVQ